MTASERYPLELAPPDISGWRRGNHEADYVHHFDSGLPGPRVVVSALVHGNEACGAVALDRLLRDGLRPCAGSLTLVFVNTAAFDRFSLSIPYANRFIDEDFNRLWKRDILEGPGQSLELQRARELRPVFDAADLLLDIHSMSTTTEALMMAGPAEKGLALARRVASPGTIVRDRGHAAGPRLRDYGDFVDPASPRNALLVECGHHFAAKSAEVALEVALRFLVTTGTIAQEQLSAYTIPPETPEQRVIEVSETVTACSEEFRFLEDYRGMDMIPKAGTVIARDGDKDLRTPYDNCILIMPVEQPPQGTTAVRLGRLSV